eukprot:2879573-Prorocentrum_lima.AAC.1
MASDASTAGSHHLGQLMQVLLLGHQRSTNGFFQHNPALCGLITKDSGPMLAGAWRATQIGCLDGPDGGRRRRSFTFGQWPR